MKADTMAVVSFLCSSALVDWAHKTFQTGCYVAAHFSHFSPLNYRASCIENGLIFGSLSSQWCESLLLHTFGNTLGNFYLEFEYFFTGYQYVSSLMRLGGYCQWVPAPRQTCGPERKQLVLYCGLGVVWLCHRRLHWKSMVLTKLFSKIIAWEN